MTSNAAPLVTGQAAAAGGFARESDTAEGGFARDFGTADGGRFIVTARTGQQFSELARTARLASTFAFLERLLRADFADPGDLYTHRDTIATLLAAWFAQRTVPELAVAFSRTSVPWAHLDDVVGR